MIYLNCTIVNVRYLKLVKIIESGNNLMLNRIRMHWKHKLLNANRIILFRASLADAEYSNNRHGTIDWIQNVGSLTRSGVR